MPWIQPPLRESANMFRGLLAVWWVSDIEFTYLCNRWPIHLQKKTIRALRFVTTLWEMASIHGGSPFTPCMILAPSPNFASLERKMCLNLMTLFGRRDIENAIPEAIAALKWPVLQWRRASTCMPWPECAIIELHLRLSKGVERIYEENWPLRC